MTNPSLSLSKGMDALAGLELELKAVMEVNPATASGVIGASAPPVIIMSASPLLIFWKDSPIA